MSLFKLKHLWLESFPQQQFDERHLTLGKIDKQPAIVLASFSGILRVYTIDNSDSDFKVTHIYETKFQSSIICIEFVAHPEERNRNTIGVLLYRKFIYMSLRRNSQTNNYEAKNLQIATEPAFLIEPKSLSLITLNSSIQYLNPISSQTIKVSDPIFPFARRDGSIYYGDGQQLVMVQNTAQQWRIVVGPMRSIHLYRDDIIVIGDNAFWQIRESQITKTKMMEEDISCGTIIEKDTDYNILVANFSNQIFIYTSNYSLIWAIKTNQVPIKICIFNHSEVFGALALLGEEGTLSISFLGTQLPETQLESINEDINMGQVQAETNKLQYEIKNKANQIQAPKHQEVVQTKNDVKLTVKAKNPRKIKQIIDKDQSYFKKDGQLWCCEIECVVKPEKGAIYQASLFLSLPSNLTCLNADQKFISIEGTKRIQLTLLCSRQKFPYSNQIQIVFRYQNADKSQGSSIIKQICELPFDFQCSLKSLQLEQKSSNKIVFKANNALPAFSQLFNEFESSLGNNKNFTVNLANGVLCSIGYNKDNTKVKIESNFFSGLCFMFVVFNSRFEKLIQGKKVSHNELSIEIPLQEFFSIMKQHCELRGYVKLKSENLERKCEEFRNIQKRLIIKMKQKVSSLNNIDKLLEYTYRKLIEAADSYEHIRDQLEVVNHNLEVALKFIFQLLFTKTKATQKCRQKVLGIVGYEKQSTQFGWEQKVMSNSAYYLNKKFNYTVDKYVFEQIYKTILWVISKINSGEWNQ